MKLPGEVASATRKMPTSGAHSRDVPPKKADKNATEVRSAYDIALLSLESVSI